MIGSCSLGDGYVTVAGAVPRSDAGQPTWQVACLTLCACRGRQCESASAINSAVCFADVGFCPVISVPSATACGVNGIGFLR